MLELIFLFHDASQIESPTLTEEQLQNLLDQCARTMSRASEDVTSIANSTARFDLCQILNFPRYVLLLKRNLLDKKRFSQSLWLFQAFRK